MLVDPDERGNYINFVKGILILFASTDGKKHYHNWDKDGMTRFHMPMCSEEELTIPKEFYFKEYIAEDLIRQRFMYVGGAPCYIFDVDNFNERINLIYKPYDKLNRELVTRILNGDSPSAKMKNRKQSLSTFFVRYKLRNPELGTKADYKTADIVFLSHYAMVKLLTYVVGLAFDDIMHERNPKKRAYYGARFEYITCARLILGGRFVKKNLD